MTINGSIRDDGICRSWRSPLWEKSRVTKSFQLTSGRKERRQRPLAQRELPAPPESRSRTSSRPLMRCCLRTTARPSTESECGWAKGRPYPFTGTRIAGEASGGRFSNSRRDPRANRKIYVEQQHPSNIAQISLICSAWCRCLRRLLPATLRRYNCLVFQSLPAWFVCINPTSRL